MKKQQKPIANFNFSSSKSDDLIKNWHDEKNKLTIITRLFDQGHIDFSEAVILLKERLVIVNSEPKEEKIITIKSSLLPFNFESTCTYFDNKDENTDKPIDK